MLLEPPPLPARPRERRTSRPGGLEVATSVSARTAHGAIVGAAFAACLVGLLGSDAGILFVVVGVWTVRRVWGGPPGVAWVLALLAAGLRWRTLGFTEIEVATRAFGPTVAVDPLLASVGASLVVAAAVAEEAARDPSSGAERAASVIVAISLVAAHLAPGIGEPTLVVSVAWWVGATAGLVAVTSVIAPAAERLPRWAPPALALVGLGLVGAAP